MYTDADIKLVFSLVTSLVNSGNPCYAVLLVSLATLVIVWRRKK